MSKLSENEQLWEEDSISDAELVVVAFGIHGRMCKDLVRRLRQEGKKVGSIRPVSLWPFPVRAFDRLPDSVRQILVVEMNLGQMVDDVRLAVNGRVPVHFFGKTGGDMPMYTLNEMIAKTNSLLGE